MLKEYNNFFTLHSNSNRNRKTFSVTTNKSSLVVESFIRLVKEYKDINIEFSIKESSGFEPIKDIYLLNSDLGIIYLKKSKKDIFLDELKRKRLSYHLISSLDPCIVVRSGHPLTLKESPLTIEDLVDYGLLKYNNAALSYEEDGDNHYHFYEYLIQKKKVKNIVSVGDRAAFHDILTQTDFISLGIGVARKQEELFGIVSIPFDFPFDTNWLEMGVVYLKNPTLNHVAKRFIEILINTYGDD